MKQPGRPRTKHLVAPRKPVAIEVYDGSALISRYEDVPHTWSVLAILKQFGITHYLTVYRTDEHGRKIIRHGQAKKRAMP